MAQFAGSRSLDERRRRRLAVESEEGPAETPATAISRRVSSANKPGTSRGPGQFPLRKIISARLWKHSVVALSGLTLGGGVLVAGWAAQVYPARLGPGFAWLFDLSAARIVRCYLSTAFFLSGQLALLIWWLRSQSLQDFKGRYRGWAGCAAVAFIAAFVVQTSAWNAWSATAQWLWHLDETRQRLSWLAPVILCGLVAGGFLHREMRDCWASSALLWLAVLVGVAAILPMASGPLSISAFSLRLGQCGLGMLAAHCVFMSLLLQSRHAIYVTVEPPADRPVLAISLWRRYRAKRETKEVSGSAVKETVASASRSRRRKRNDDSSRSVETRTEDVPANREENSPELQQAKPSARQERRAMRRSA